VKCVASHGGVTVGEDGTSAQAIEDLALATSLIPFDVVVPADFEEAKQAIVAVGKTSRPAYVRTGRPKVPGIYDSSYRFQLGRASVLRPGTDVTLIACGIMVGIALSAAAALAGEGVSARVLNMATIKPIDREAVPGGAGEARSSPRRSTRSTVASEPRSHAFSRRSCRRRSSSWAWTATGRAGSGTNCSGT
jgi:transketolase